MISVPAARSREFFLIPYLCFSVCILCTIHVAYPLVTRDRRFKVVSLFVMWTNSTGQQLHGNKKLKLPHELQVSKRGRWIRMRTAYSFPFIDFYCDYFWCGVLRAARGCPTPASTTACLLAEQLKLLCLARRPSRCGQNAGRGGEGAGPRCGKERGGETGGAEAAGRGEKGQICQDGSREGKDETRHQGQGTMVRGGRMEGRWQKEEENKEWNIVIVGQVLRGSFWSPHSIFVGCYFYPRSVELREESWQTQEQRRVGQGEDSGRQLTCSPAALHSCSAQPSGCAAAVRRRRLSASFTSCCERSRSRRSATGTRKGRLGPRPWLITHLWTVQIYTADGVRTDGSFNRHTGKYTYCVSQIRNDQIKTWGHLFHIG